MWLDPQHRHVVLASCAQPGCSTTLQFGPGNLQLQDGAGKIISFEVEDARLPVLRAKEDGSRLMPAWVVPTGREPGGH